MADRVGVINNGELILTEEKSTLMSKLGTKQMTIDLKEPLREIPDRLSNYDLKLTHESLVFSYDSKKEENGISSLLDDLREENIGYHDLHTKQSSLEEIFVELVKRK